MAIVSKITDEMKVKGKKKFDFYMLRGILPVVRSWPKRRKTPFRPRELEAQGVLGILSKNTTLIKDKVREAWIVESIGKRPRWQDTFIGLGMKYWGINNEIPPILLDYQIHYSSPQFELEILIKKIEELTGEPIAQEIQSTGIVDIEDIETYREKLYFSLYNTKGIRLIAPFLEFIIGKNIDFTIWLQKLIGFIEEPIQVCFTEANVRIPEKKYYYYHGVKYDCVIEPKPKPYKCLPISGKRYYMKIYCSESQYSVYNQDDDYFTAWNAVQAKGTTKHIGQYYYPPRPNNYHILRCAHILDATVLPIGAIITGATYNFELLLDQTDTDFDMIIQNLWRAEYPYGLKVYNRLNFEGLGGRKNTLGIKGVVSIELNKDGVSWIEYNKKTQIGVRSIRDIEGEVPTGLEFLSYKGRPWFDIEYVK